MIRRMSFVFVLCAAAAPLAPFAPLAAQVGHEPSKSPFEDLRGRQGFTVGLGLINTSTDPAGVGPGAGYYLHGRYDYHFTGPLWGVVRLTYAPGLERTVKDPDVTGPARIVGTTEEPLIGSDIGLSFNLTGNKAYKRIAPRLNLAMGFLSTFDGTYDLGGYRFGTKFTVTYGIGVRLATKNGWDLTADLNRVHWQMRYPDAYGGDGGSTDTSILGNGKLAPWTGHAQLSLGLTKYLFR